MIKILKSRNMGKSNQGWLHSVFHFSFAEYYNPDNLNFGALRVINDDVFDAGHGFDTHPHQNMEIISYVIEGELTHKDSMGNVRALTRGQVQYMSAGVGVTHSEYNLSNKPLHFLQIWILPDRNGYQPNYGDYKFDWKDREGRWLSIASGKENSPVTIHQDMDIWVLWLSKDQKIDYQTKSGRQLYLVQIEGSGILSGKTLKAKDAAEITKENQISLCAVEDSHYILFDMKEA